MTIKETYHKLQKKHKQLPDFSLLDREFEISTIENTQFLLREIRRKIVERIETLVDLLEEFLQPEATVVNLQESKVFTEAEKKDMFVLFRKCMLAHRSALQIGISGKEEEHAKFIAEITADWDKVKKQMHRILEKVKEAWRIDESVEEETGYFG
ncbi:hypothetical protein HYS48_03690 [Candidatus Woesearchaeota archaeon]|nr:hypothetical protein [Candidatus Woesearchaeota archaeon]